ncbi:MAG TPA: sigma-70 family RNA polymerase sigma factor [Candidatus Sumerlaeota bacterium]|nr:sigma-70 family RNA polymerase sigma factor [Candidatus Sumerlaeota bacterium]HMX62184.1 sigma-70 family RNA polymerase sigma factor [Candidatus Sumerlaeota bacterium]
MAFEPPFSPEEERRLLARAQRGDRHAFGELVEAYKERAFAGALSLTQNYDDARDLSQDAFVKAFKAIKRFQLGRPFYPWYYRILRNLCLTHLERHGPKRRVSLELLVEVEHVQFEAPTGDVVEDIQRQQMAAHLRVAIEKLKPEFKEIIAMKHFEEMSYEEIAQALKIPIGTVMSRLFHARKALGELMREHVDGR